MATAAAFAEVSAAVSADAARSRRVRAVPSSFVAFATPRPAAADLRRAGRLRQGMDRLVADRARVAGAQVAAERSRHLRVLGPLQRAASLLEAGLGGRRLLAGAFGVGARGVDGGRPLRGRALGLGGGHDRRLLRRGQPAQLLHVGLVGVDERPEGTEPPAVAEP